MAAIWKPVPSYPGMLASSEGEILLPPRHAPMRSGGYRLYETRPVRGYVVTASRDATSRHRIIRTRYFGTIKVHQAVCEAFHGPKPTPKHVVLHRDEDGTNNDPENLKWGTRKENQNAPGFKAWAAKTCRAKMAGISGMRKD